MFLIERRILSVAAILLLVFATVTRALGQTTKMDWWSINAGGNVQGSAGVTIGQSVIGSAHSLRQSASLGFWPQVSETLYICGDVDHNGFLNIMDMVYLVEYIFGGGPAPYPLQAGDADNCGTVNVSDLAYLTCAIFDGGPAPCQRTWDCYLPAGINSISLGCRIIAYANGDSVPVPVFISNDTPLSDFTVGFRYNSSDVEITSVDTTGTVIPSGKALISKLDSASNTILLGFVETGHPVPVQQGGLLATLRVRIPLGTPPQVIDIDSAFIPPAGEFIFSTGCNSGSIRPTLSDCDSNIIVVICDCLRGDADGNGFINISDAVYLINYIFSGGPAPTPYPVCSGDADCNCIVNISDAVYLIAYIFGGGPAPCDCQTWLVNCGSPLRK